MFGFQRFCGWMTALVVLALGTLWSPQAAMACPFCTAISQTFRQEFADTDAIIFVESADGPLPEGSTPDERPYRVIEVFKGEHLMKVGDIVASRYYSQTKSGQRFLLQGFDGPPMLWTSPQPLNERTEAYIRTVLSLPKDDAKAQLTFFQKHLYDEEPILARDAYDEFALAPYTDLLKIKDQLDVDQLLARGMNRDLTPADRKLAFTLLGICDDKRTIEPMEEMLKKRDPNDRVVLDALGASYLVVKGTEGLALIESQYLNNMELDWGSAYSLLAALRFHATELKVIPREEVVQTMACYLNNYRLADLVVSELARFEDWSYIDRLMEMYRNHPDPEGDQLRIKIVNYLRACPLPAAREAFEVCKQIDPTIVRRANTYNPRPMATSPDGNSSSMVDPSANRWLAWAVSVNSGAILLTLMWLVLLAP
jgi:hypothetical protein